MQSLSVIICTYNPDEKIFARCLDCIMAASVKFTPFEIVIVDNNSFNPIVELSNVASFINKVKNVRIVVEKKQGLTPARLRGIKESKGDLLVFVDDDNFIEADFFANAIQIAEQYHFLGSYSGQVKLLFETLPPPWTKKYWGLLVYREFSGRYWSNLPNLAETMPYGAGMFVRRNVADYYVKLHNTGKRDIQLDRTATSLFSAGDNDLAACACDIGMGMGIFDSLVLNHYIPKERITKNYLIRLAEGIAQSAVVFRAFRGELPRSLSVKTKIANKLRLLFKNRIDRQFQKAVNRGEKIGKASFENHTYS